MFTLPMNNYGFWRQIHISKNIVCVRSDRGKDPLLNFDLYFISFAKGFIIWKQIRPLKIIRLVVCVDSFLMNIMPDTIPISGR